MGIARVNALPTVPVAEPTMSHQTTPPASALTHAGLRDRLASALRLPTLGGDAGGARHVFGDRPGVGGGVGVAETPGLFSVGIG
jgi:hypothetical protein